MPIGRVDPVQKPQHGWPDFGGGRAGGRVKDRSDLLTDLDRRSNERLAQLNEAIGREDGGLATSPWEEVRDFFHYCDNYIDAIDRAAERIQDRLLGRLDRRQLRQPGLPHIDMTGRAHDRAAQRRSHRLPR